MGAIMQDYTKLKVWQKSHALTVSMYNVTAVFPDHEVFGLTRQIRRAAFSIPANIAEGCGRGANPELRQFLYVALGSASELEYYILLAKDLHIFTDKQFAALQPRVNEIKRMLAGLIETVSKDSAPPH
jgi:four helix bundle protein